MPTDRPENAALLIDQTLVVGFHGPDRQTDGLPELYQISDTMRPHTHTRGRGEWHSGVGPQLPTSCCGGSYFLLHTDRLG